MLGEKKNHESIMEEKERLADTDISVNIDQMLVYTGEFKRFQWLLDTVFCAMILPTTYQVLIMYFAALNPSWKCVENSTICTSNKTFASDDNARCSIPRGEWMFTEDKSFSIVTQFDIYCKGEWQIHLSTSILFIGWGVGAIVLGWLADNYGRKFVLFPSVFIVLFVGFITAFLPNMPLFMICRFIVGFFTPGTAVQMFIIMSEFVGSRYRPIAGIILWFFFSVALCILGLKAYFIRKWKLLYIVCTAPYLFVLIFYKFVPESVRWLRLRRRKEDAMIIFEKIAKINKKDIPANVAISIPSNIFAEHKSSPVQLFRTNKIAVSSLVQGSAWFVNGMVYYGLSLAADDLGGSLYRNYVLVSIVEFPAVILAIDFSERFGRKKTTIIAMAIGSVACITVAFIPAVGYARIIRIILGMVGKLCITLSFDTIYTWSLEIFPTEIRAEGMGFLQVTSRMGAASAPWVAKGLKNIHKTAPFLFMGITALIAAAACYILPETKGLPTSETNDDAIELKDGMELE